MATSRAHERGRRITQITRRWRITDAYRNQGGTIATGNHHCLTHSTGESVLFERPTVQP
jgi:hypothetical protein